MNLILLTTDDYIDQNKVRLTGRRQAHIRSVLRASVGQSLRVGLLNDRIGRAIVTALNDNEVELQVSLDTPPPQPLDITLILALPRPKVCRRLLQDITTLGVKEVFLLNSWKVEKSFWQSPLLTTEALQQPLHLGL
ncbi:MAG: 16S rRNA (uracil(1498)-N(3))-methyltransferase, partial [Desulfuromonadales bacterium]|nr:16S rRNA (uracil(1498)-N(3))-methyltransferase [Desulfuromonadales bacterium]